MSTLKSDQGILLETGTNEVEIIEFYLGGQSFGINVAKVKQIVQFEENLLTRIPETHPAILGTFLYRGSTIPLVDLNKALHRERGDEEESKRPLVLVSEFNRTINSFQIDGVNRIHRISWDELQPMSQIFSTQKSSFIGSVSLNGREMLIVDVEELLAEINPESSFAGQNEQLKQLAETEATEDKELRIVLAEDSNFIRESIVQRMGQCGFKHVRAFENGKVAHDYLSKLKQEIEESGKDVKEFINIVVSDIEMPQLDGLTLCKYIKDDPVLGVVPVIMFSSLINDQMIHKCKSVGADACTSKPKLVEMIELITKHAIR